MATVHTTGATQPAKLIRDAFDRQFMKTLDKELIAADLMEQKVFPANSGTTIQFHRIQNIQHRTQGLSATFAAAQQFGNAWSIINTTAGNLYGKTFTVDTISATMSLIGDDFLITEADIIMSEPNPVPELSDRVFYEAAAVMERKCLNTMVSNAINGESATSTNPQANYNGSSVTASTVWGDGSATLTEATLDADNPTHLISAETFNTGYALLSREGVMRHPRASGPSRYVSIIGPGSARDLRQDSTFQEIALKGHLRGENKFESASIGDVFGVQVMISPYVTQNGVAGTIDSTNDEIVRCPIFGADYACRVAHAKGVGRPSVRFLPPSMTHANVYGNIAHIVWKAYWASLVKNPLCGVVAKHATTLKAPSTSGDDEPFLTV